MPSRPSRLTDLSKPDAVKVINQLFEEFSKRVDDVDKKATIKRLASQSVLFGKRGGTFSVAANSCVEAIVNLQGANTNLVAHANPTLPLGSINLIWSAYVFQANQVKIRLCNPTTSSITANVVPWNILVN